jgi:hypothetical protein
MSIVTSTITTSTPAGTLTYESTAAPTQSGISSSCTDYYLVRASDTCYSIQDQYMSFTLDQFYSWNPLVFLDLELCFLPKLLILDCTVLFLQAVWDYCLDTTCVWHQEAQLL